MNATKKNFYRQIVQKYKVTKERLGQFGIDDFRIGIETIVQETDASAFNQESKLQGSRTNSQGSANKELARPLLGQ